MRDIYGIARQYAESMGYTLGEISDKDAQALIDDLKYRGADADIFSWLEEQGILDLNDDEQEKLCNLIDLIAEKMPNEGADWYLWDRAAEEILGC